MIIKPDSNFHTIAGKSVTDRNDVRYREYRRRWAEQPLNFEAGDFPLHLDIEPSNICNLRCTFCATTYNNYNKGFMKEEIWKKILDEAGENGLCSLKFTYRGEPLLHKDLPRMIKYAKDVGVMDVYFNTNALKLDEGAIRKLIDAGLDRISISFEGTDKETYEKYRVGSDYNTVVRNIILLKEIKEELGIKFPLTRIQSVLVAEMIGKEKEYANFWQPFVDEVAYLDMKDEANNPDHCGISYDWACPMLWQRMTISWDGNILPCCHDIYGKMKLGNISNTTIKELWNGLSENWVRYLHKNNHAHELPACDRCPLRASEIMKIV